MAESTPAQTVASGSAQRAADVAAAPDALALLQDANPAYAANKRLVFDMWRSVVNAGHVELADELMREDYIQHSPVLPTGRAAFKAIFSAVPKRDIPELVSPPLAAILAEGKLVVMALREEWPEPDGSGHYSTTHFNLFRVEDARLAEHWHSVQQAPGPNVQPPDKGGPQRVTGSAGTAQYALLQDADPQLAANKRLVFDAWRQLYAAGREELAGVYLTEGFVEHDPTRLSGLQGFRSTIAAQADEQIETTIREPIVAIVAQGDLVVLVRALVHPHPIRQDDTYTTTGFDMFRIENGRIAEHWSGAMKPNTPMPIYGN